MTPEERSAEIRRIRRKEERHDEIMEKLALIILTAWVTVIFSGYFQECRGEDYHPRLDYVAERLMEINADDIDEGAALVLEVYELNGSSVEELRVVLGELAASQDAIPKRLYPAVNYFLWKGQVSGQLMELLDLEPNMQAATRYMITGGRP